MSKRTRKPKTTKRGASADKSSAMPDAEMAEGKVPEARVTGTNATDAEVAEAKVTGTNVTDAEMGDPRMVDSRMTDSNESSPPRTSDPAPAPLDAKPLDAPPGSRASLAPASGTSIPPSSSLHSLIPSTDEIDDEWGGADASDGAGASAASGSSAAQGPSAASASTPALGPTDTVGGHGHSDSAATSKSVVPAGGRPKSADADDASEKAAAQVAPRASARSSTPTPTKSNPETAAPKHGTASGANESPQRPSAIPRAVPPHVEGMASKRPATVPPPPSSRKLTPIGGTPVPASVAPRSLTPPAGMAATRPSTPPQIPESKRISAVPRPVGTGSEKGPARPSQIPNPTPPVVRAVVLPPLVTPQAGDVRPPADSYEELASPELKRDLVPVPKAAASIIESPAPLELELVRVHPGTSDEEDPLPPPTPYEQAASSMSGASNPPPTPFEQASPPREPQVSQALLLEEIAPSDGEAAVSRTEVSTAPTSSAEPQTKADATPVASVASLSDAGTPPIEPPDRGVVDAKSSGEAKSAEPTSDRKPKDATLAATIPEASPPTAVEAAPATPELAVVTARSRRGRFYVGLATLWIVTAAIPAVVVWQVMRKSAQASPSLSMAEYCAKVDPLVRTNNLAASPTNGDPTNGNPTVSNGAPSVVMSASHVSGDPSGTPSAASTSDVPSDPSGAPSALAPSAVSVPSDPSSAPSAAAPDPSTASSAAVVVETQSDDRVNVLIKSNPDGMRVYRRGKVLGRTPLVIQIGRGDRRVFEVGTPSLGNKRISLDGEKTEILVSLVGDAKTAPVSQPATLPDRMRERLR